jgi:hypothetical protein
MKRFARLVVITLGLAILGLVLSLVPRKDAHAQGATPVQVVNTPLPVSVSGIVGVVSAGRGSLRVDVTNTPLPVSGTVGLASGSEVIMPTHLGVPAGNLVTLWCFTTSTGCSSFRQVSPGGVMATTDYSIPPGETLIVTDLNWSAIGGSPGRTIFLNLGCTSGCGFTYNSSVVADVNGEGSTNDHLTSGLDLVYLPTIVLGDATRLEGLTLRGYLTP